MNGVLRAQSQRLAENGAEYLDHMAALGHEVVPVRWHNVIDLNILDVARPTRCILAQLGQASDHNLLHYVPVARSLGMEPYPLDHHDEAFQRGFHVVVGEWEFEEYHYLTVAWKWLILRRRAADHPVHVRMALAS